jgi:signal transduction histidine kinase
LRVLELAAIFGTSFHDAHVASAIQLSPEELGFALASARRAGIVEAEEPGRHRFVHDSLREMLVDDLTVAERRRLHQRAAEILEAKVDPTFEELVATALHYGAGKPAKDPVRAYRVARAAGEAALARFDNETALRFLSDARMAAEGASMPLDPAFFSSIGEAHLRLGTHEESLAAFEAALERAKGPGARATILGRISWVFQARADPDRAWERLGAAFAVLGARMPVEDVGSAASTSAHVVRARVGRLLDRPSRRTQGEIDLLCQLHYQNARLGLEYAKPARLMQSALESLELGERGGSASIRARTRAYYALVLTAFGRRDAGAREVASAIALATRAGDPAALAFCVQIQFVAAGWAGDIDRSLVILAECADIHGPWLELNEYCQNVGTGDLIQSMRGRSSEAWPWMARATERLRRTRTRPVAADFVIHRTRAALAAIGRDVSDDPWLTSQLASLSPRDPGQGFNRLMSWGPRARYYVECGDLGVEFEELVAAFRAEGHNPRQVHPAVAEYYLSVAHARMHQAVRTEPSHRAMKLPALRAAVADLGASAKIPLFKTHHLVAQGYLAWFEGRLRVAKSRFAEAEALANQQSCAWVLYAVARARAHMLLDAGKNEAAKDQGRVALLFAREHGAVTRARWITEELGLTESASAAPRAALSSRGSSSSRATRQLTTLLQVVRAPRRDLKSEQQAGAILDELINSLAAERGAIWFQPEGGAAGTTVARHRSSEASVSMSPDSPRGELLRSVHESGMSWPTAEGEVWTRRDDYTFDATRVVAVPLFLYERPVGALSIERRSESPPFEPDDRNLLLLLSHQVPIALEIARLLFEREQLHASLQHAKKMEAMGALAGGLAHDFNNMLAAIRVALNAAQERAVSDAELTVDLDIIAEATTRAAQLTGQLLSFSRHQPVPVRVHDVNRLVSTLEPMLKRVVGAAIHVDVRLAAAVDSIEVDQGSFDQALVNLFINARDAMPEGGTISLSTRNVALGETDAQRAGLAPGPYVELEVADTGEGMSAETVSRIFEPFFTTKAPGTGTGLGLAMVYAFARNSGGSIEVASELGRGTAFKLYLRRVEGSRMGRPARHSVPIEAAPVVTTQVPDTILVVDDDDLVRRSIAKILERNGYRVLAASGSVEALDVAREQGGRIGLVILDVLMPGLTGPELGRRLYDLKLPAKLLFVSGFSPESIPIEQAQVASDMLLQKPFSQSTLLERVRKLMHA